jgi:hypothetical protein
MSGGQTLSPAARRLRTKIATSVQRGRMEEAEQARREFKAVKAEDYIRELVDSAPALTDDMKARLALLLKGAA